MVKKLDQGDFPEQLDHVGVALWQAAEAWKAAFDVGMVDMGYPWFAQARSGLIAHIPREGIRQSDLVAAAGMTKQAVQQLLDELEADGIVERTPDPEDRRGRIVTYAAAGKRVLADANIVKKRVEAALRQRLGAKHFAQLIEALALLNHGGRPPHRP